MCMNTSAASFQCINECQCYFMFSVNKNSDIRKDIKFYAKMDNFQNGKKPVYFDNTEICIMRIL